MGIAARSFDRESEGDRPDQQAQDCNIKIAAAAWAPTANAAELEQMRPDFLFSSVSAFSDFLRKSLK
jgi:hypothetical protein